MFQIKIKLLNEIRWFCLIDPVCLLNARPLHIKPGQDTHVFSKIVIFRLSGKECDESAIVKGNIDKNNSYKGGEKFGSCQDSGPTE